VNNFDWKSNLRPVDRKPDALPLHHHSTHAVASLPALGPGHPQPNGAPRLARKYLPGFPYSWSLRRLRQKISSIYCQLGAPQKEKKSEALTTCRVCPLVKTVLHPWPIHMQKINVKGQTVQKLEQKQSKRTRPNLLPPSLMRSVNNTYCTQIWKISPLLVFTITWLILNRFW